MSYAFETEAKLAAHAAVRAGRAVLVFCGTGFEWHLSELEDFADAYALAPGREDGPFAEMEQHALASKGITPVRSLSGFAVLLRHREIAKPDAIVYPVTTGCARVWTPLLPAMAVAPAAI